MDNLLNLLIKSINKKEVLGLLKDLMSVEGHINCPGQEQEISSLVYELVKGAGIEVNVQPVEPGRNNVIAKVAGQGKKKSLALNGHLDTVPPSEEMEDFRPRQRDGKIFGLGSADMKGGVAAMIYSMMLVKRLGIELAGDLYFTGVIGEESGGTGTRYLINESGFKADYHIVGEPTQLKVVNSHKGVSRYQATIKGKAVHASMPYKGLNAIRAMAGFIQLVDHNYLPLLASRKQPQVGSATINYGIIQGGKDINIVADRCILKIDRRWTQQEQDMDIKAELEAYLRKACREEEGYQYQLKSLLPANAYYGPFYIPPDHEFMSVCRQAYQRLGLKFENCGMQGWTDGATIWHKGYPTLIIGPGSIENAHTAGEFIIIDELIEAVKIYLSLICEICI